MTASVAVAQDSPAQDLPAQDLPAESPIQARPSAAPRVLAVLPFVGVGNEGSEAFGEGITDELIHELSSWAGIRVVARSSCYQFKGRSEDVRRIGESLGASALVSGSVRIEGPRVRVLAQLVDAESGVNLRSSAYDRDLGDILATQREISGELSGIVRRQFAGSQSGVATA